MANANKKSFYFSLSMIERLKFHFTKIVQVYSNFNYTVYICQHPFVPLHCSRKGQKMIYTNWNDSFGFFHYESISPGRNSVCRKWLLLRKEKLACGKDERSSLWTTQLNEANIKVFSISIESSSFSIDSTKKAVCKNRTRHWLN